MPFTPTATRCAGILLGVLADAVFGDPRRGHPVAGFGRFASVLERRLYQDSRRRGVIFTAVAVGVPLLGGAAAERAGRHRPVVRLLSTAGATWCALGGRSLAGEGEVMGRLLDRGDLPQARRRLSHLCARDASRLDAPNLARATVESLAENTSDAVVAPLLWGAVAGVPGALGYRAVNTLDAMVGYTSPRYRRFGWASARCDDLANLVPARVAGVVTAACAPVVGGSPREAIRVLRRDGARHPSPNAGHPEAAAAGALGVCLGGENVYQGQEEQRPVLGEGRAVRVDDVPRAVRLTRVVGWVSAAVAITVTAAAGAAVSAARRPGGGPGPGIGSAGGGS